MSTFDDKLEDFEVQIKKAERVLSDKRDKADNLRNMISTYQRSLEKLTENIDAREAREEPLKENLSRMRELVVVLNAGMENRLELMADPAKMAEHEKVIAEFNKLVLEMNAILKGKRDN